MDAERHPEDASPAKIAAEFVPALVAALDDPAVVFDRHLDVVAANPVAGAVSASFTVGVNLARFTFLNPMVEETTEAWSLAAALTASTLRTSLERFGEDRRFRTLLGDLMAHSAAFAERWAAPPIAAQPRGTVVFTNPLVGVLHLGYEQLQRGVDDDLTVILWAAADPESTERLSRLRELVDGATARP